MNIYKRLMLISVVMTLIAVSGCVTNPVTGKEQLMLISPTQDVEIGKKYAPEIEKQLGGKIESPVITQYVNSIGQKVARVSHDKDLKFTYIAVNDDSMNALALPGGYIFITRGMLEKLENESQLAGILAHETLHVTARHSAAAMSQQIGMGILMTAAMTQTSSQGAANAANLTTQLIGLKYSRENEKEADRYGMDYMVKAGYSPNGMVETMQILAEESRQRPVEFFSTHPNPENRVGLLKRHIGKRGYDYNYQGLKVGPKQYKENILDILETIPEPIKRPEDFRPK
jgi:predicted Zn-dependent protease